MVQHVLRNIVSPVTVQATFIFAYAMLAEAGLSFLGVGVDPSTPTWGIMVNEGRQYIDQAAFLIVFPGIAISVAVLSLQLIGDGLRDALDPRLSKGALNGAEPEQLPRRSGWTRRRRSTSATTGWSSMPRPRGRSGWIAAARTCRPAGATCTCMSGTAAPTSRSARRRPGRRPASPRWRMRVSAGEASFHGLREYVIDPAAETVRAFLNIGSIGLVACNRVPELIDLRSIDVDRTLAVVEANRDVICGIKVRASAA